MFVCALAPSGTNVVNDIAKANARRLIANVKPDGHTGRRMYVPVTRVQLEIFGIYVLTH